MFSVHFLAQSRPNIRNKFVIALLERANLLDNFDRSGQEINASLVPVSKVNSQFFPVVSTCNILAEYVVAGYGLISLPSTVKAI